MPFFINELHKKFIVHWLKLFIFLSNHFYKFIQRNSQQSKLRTLSYIEKPAFKFWVIQWSKMLDYIQPFVLAPFQKFLNHGQRIINYSEYFQAIILIKIDRKYPFVHFDLYFIFFYVLWHFWTRLILLFPKSLQTLFDLF